MNVDEYVLHGDSVDPHRTEEITPDNWSVRRHNSLRNEEATQRGNRSGQRWVPPLRGSGVSLWCPHLHSSTSHVRTHVPLHRTATPRRATKITAPLQYLNPKDNFFFLVRGKVDYMIRYENQPNCKNTVMWFPYPHALQCVVVSFIIMSI